MGNRSWESFWNYLEGQEMNLMFMCHHDLSCFIGGLWACQEFGRSQIPISSQDSVHLFDNLCSGDKHRQPSTSNRRDMSPFFLPCSSLYFHLGWLTSSHTSLWRPQLRLSLAIITSATKPQVGLQDLGLAAPVRHLMGNQLYDLGMIWV